MNLQKPLTHMPTLLYIIRAMLRKNTNKLSRKELEVLRYIRNTLMNTGKSPSIRELQVFMGYKSPRSITVILGRLFEKKILVRHGERQLAIINEPDESNFNASTVNVPLVGIGICGTPLLAEEHIQAMIQVSTELARPPHKYFLLRACGDSMNDAGINDGDLILVRQQSIANENNIVVALIDSEVTIKRLKKANSSITLIPCSKNKKHLPIILQRDFIIQGVVIKILGKYDILGDYKE